MRSPGRAWRPWWRSAQPAPLARPVARTITTARWWFENSKKSEHYSPRRNKATRMHKHTHCETPKCSTTPAAYSARCSVRSGCCCCCCCCCCRRCPGEEEEGPESAAHTARARTAHNDSAHACMHINALHAHARKNNNNEPRSGTCTGTRGKSRRTPSSEPPGRRAAGWAGWWSDRATESCRCSLRTTSTSTTTTAAGCCC